MKIQPTLLLAGLLSCGLATTALAASNLVIDTGGQMRIQLDLPLAEDVDHTTPVTMGRVEIAPIEFIPGLAGHFWLNRISLSFAPFQINRFLYGDHAFTSVGANLNEAVSFWAVESQPGVYTFSIPPDELTLFGAALDNSDVKAGNQHPSEDVTGTIDLNANTFEARAVFTESDTVAGQDIGGPLTITLNGVIAAGTDTDGDGVPDIRDNCVLTSNPAQQPVASPVVTAPPTVQACTCAVSSLGTAQGVDICSAQPVTLTNDAPLEFGVGTTSVTWTGRTASGGVGTALQLVKVVDRTRPVFLSVPPTITFQECHPVDIGLAMAADDCDFGSPHVTNDAPHHFRPGRTVVTWKATDHAGNRTTARQIVNVTSCHCHDHSHGH
jgi:Thrombospondin type 3 repeat